MAYKDNLHYMYDGKWNNKILKLKEKMIDERNLKNEIQ